MKNIEQILKKRGFEISWCDGVWARELPRKGMLEYTIESQTMCVWGGTGSSYDYAFDIKVKNTAHLVKIINWLVSIQLDQGGRCNE